MELRSDVLGKRYRNLDEAQRTDLQYSLLRQQIVSLLRKDPPLPNCESKTAVIDMYSEVDGASGQFGPNLVVEVPSLALAQPWCAQQICSVCRG